MATPPDFFTGAMSWRGTLFWESLESPKETRSRDHGRVTRTLACGWHLRHIFRGEVLGYTEVQNGGTSAARLHRKQPMPYEPYPDWGTMYAVSIDNMRPLGKPTGITTDGLGYPQYTGFAQMDVQFEHLDWKLDGEDTVMEDGVNVAEMRRCVNIREQPHGEFLTVDGGYFQWTAETDATKKRTSIRLRKQDLTSAFTITCMDFPGIGVPVTEFIGKVNSKPMSFTDHIRYYDFNPQTMLLVDADRKPVWMPNGKPAFNRIFYFNYRPNFVGSVDNGWNWERRFKPGPPPTWAYEKISVDGTDATTDDNMLYNEKDHRLLFTVLRT